MSPLVWTEDLIDARGVADILGLAQPNSVSLYQRRYADMPRPVINLGPKRPMLWLRAEIEAWAAARDGGNQLHANQERAIGVAFRGDAEGCRREDDSKKSMDSADSVLTEQPASG